ncbi:MAG: hypothetical protein ACFFDV_10695 [Candidatus Thorarchaeota archaeon]
MRRLRMLDLRAIAIVLILLVVSPIPSKFSSVQFMSINESSYYITPQKGLVNESQKTQIDEFTSPQNVWTPSDGSTPPPADGILQPVTIEQRGYSSTGNVSARTDTLDNTQQSLLIDTGHNWVGSQIETEVWNLERLYVVNGTFDEGYPGLTINPNGTLVNYPLGWSAISNSSNIDQVQQVSYEESANRYVTVQNKPKLTNPGQKEYTHYDNTTILWYQTFENIPFTNQFFMSFKYLYLQGPITASFASMFSLKVAINDTVVSSLSLSTLSNRGTWFDSGIIPVTIPYPSATMKFQIGLVIDSTFVVDADIDYDSDGIADGVTITACLDDISLISVTSPSCEEVNLSLRVGSATAPILGDSGSGSGSLVNSSYWILSPIGIEITANTSVSLDYRIRLLNHRFLNSSSAINIAKEGVAYSISSDASGSLEMYTYLGILGLYDELVLRIYHPEDWQNFTIQDPFLTDVTSTCTLGSEYVEIPTSLLDRLGWWKILCESPNYASDAVMQRYDTGTTHWVNETIFHSSDSSLANVTLSFDGIIPILSDPVNFTWTIPNGSIWYESSTTSGAFGKALSTAVTFGPINTTAGPWGLIYHWTNGSEIAYGCVEFALHHQAALEVVFSENLDTVVGQPVTIVLAFYDSENGLYILADEAEIIGTWAAGVVEFEPNIVKNWWQADFDTALVGAGNFDVSLSSAAPYFETTPMIITIKSHFLTSLDSPNGPLQPLTYSRLYSFNYFYSINYNGSGIDGAIVEISGEGSEWASVTNTGNGHYNLSLSPLGSRDYSILLSFSKEGYQNQTHVLSFLVDKIPIKVTSSLDFRGSEFQRITIEIELVEADTENPVSDANVNLNLETQSMLVHMDELETGLYSASIIMPEAGDTYNARVIIEKENYETIQDFSITLIPIFDANARLFQTVMNYSSQIIMFAGVLVAVVAGQKYFSRKRNRKHTLARVIKARFNDANNLLGIVVLHRLSGVPIYSKILKGGFEEGMLSAFITAIMHFRAEFDKRRESDDYIIIPISDVVRSVPTQNLICAFITITSASKNQEERMINYARAIGMMFDEVLSERPSQVVDPKMIKTFEWLFDDFVDGVLVRPHQIGEKRLPKKLRCVEDVVNTEDGIDSFMLVNLIQLLESCGIDEDDAYLLVMDAIEQEYIIPIYSNNNNLGTDLGEV